MKPPLSRPPPGAQHAIDCDDRTNVDHFLPDGHFTLHVARGWAAHSFGGGGHPGTLFQITTDLAHRSRLEFVLFFRFCHPLSPHPARISHPRWTAATASTRFFRLSGKGRREGSMNTITRNAMDFCWYSLCRRLSPCLVASRRSISKATLHRALCNKQQQKRDGSTKPRIGIKSQSISEQLETETLSIIDLSRL